MEKELQWEIAYWMDQWSNNVMGRIWRLAQGGLPVEQIVEATGAKTAGGYLDDDEPADGRAPRRVASKTIEKLLKEPVSPRLRE